LFFLIDVSAPPRRQNAVSRKDTVLSPTDLQSLRAAAATHLGLIRHTADCVTHMGRSTHLGLIRQTADRLRHNGHRSAHLAFHCWEIACINPIHTRRIAVTREGSPMVEDVRWGLEAERRSLKHCERKLSKRRIWGRARPFILISGITRFFSQNYRFIVAVPWFSREWVRMVAGVSSRGQFYT
jgi:hypothetical protein